MSEKLTVEALEKMKVPELKAELSKRSLPTSGVKQVLLDRLKAAIDPNAKTDKEEDDDDDDDDEEESEEEEKPKKKGTKRKASGKQSASKKAKVADDNSSSSATDFTKPEVAKDELKIVTWNVASLKAIMDKGFMDYLKGESPDIICLNETKVSETAYAGSFDDLGYKHNTFYSAIGNTGYSGTAILSKIKPVSVQKGINIKDHDDEGRAITAEYDNFYVVATYIPNAGAADKDNDKMPKDLDYRMKWDEDFLKYLKGLKEKKSVIWCGDLNVAHKEVDLANPKTNKKTAGFTQKERDNFQKVLDAGFIDSYRVLNPDTKSVYTFWSYKFNSRAKNTGWRLDYFVASKDLQPRITNVYPRTAVMGSDHCPLVLHLKKEGEKKNDNNSSTSS